MKSMSRNTMLLMALMLAAATVATAATALAGSKTPVVQIQRQVTDSVTLSANAVRLVRLRSIAPVHNTINR